MSRPLRLLIAEDSDSDLQLLVRELRRGGFELSYRCVETAEQVREALAANPWDAVLSDWNLPQLDALGVLSIVKESGHDLPFIIVSGAIDDASAVEAMRAGAHDFISKQSLVRLAPAMERELREAAIRREQKMMQEQLLLTDRMVSMGTLAAGVAHEINNPLASVLANLELAAQEIEACGARHGISAELAELTDEISDARECAERIRNIVRDLKIFSRSDEAKRGAIDVHRVLDSTLRMAWNELRHRAKVVKRYGQPPLVQANESRLGQVFLNLIVNAAHAIGEGRASSNELRVSTGTSAEGHAFIEIADTGSGMPPEVLAKLFTPFFTTKPIGVGTGLGLSICQRIITELGGTIEVTSQVGQGTTFRVELPAAPAKAPAEARPPTASVEPARRRGRILVIDDEPLVARAAERTLDNEHDVVVPRSGAEAVQRITAGERFDVILCDLMMPQLSGMQLHAELSAIAPDQAERIVFLTGGAFTPESRAFLERTPNPRIDKPFDTAQLRAIVNARLR